MESFSSTAGWKAGRPVAFGSTAAKPSARRSSCSTNASMTRTGLSSAMKSSSRSANSVACPRAWPVTNRFMGGPQVQMT